jgi:DNA-binding response OmpR family regulator
MALSGGRTHTRVVLVAEDDPHDAFFLKRAFWLSSRDWEVIVVQDGEGVLRYFQRLPPYDDPVLCPWPALVLLDLKLPLVNGFEVLGWLKQQRDWAAIPVVVVTGQLSPADRKRVLELGAQGCIEKPGHLGDWSKLVAAARQVCGV